jgi:hypothetical protein
VVRFLKRQEFFVFQSVQTGSSDSAFWLVGPRVKCLGVKMTIYFHAVRRLCMRFLEHEAKMTLAHCASLVLYVHGQTSLSDLLPWSCCIFLAFVICCGISSFVVLYWCNFLGFFSASGNICNQPCRFHFHKAAECLGACEN